ncbi:MAG: anti-sigma factor family protein [Blastocatellia bacterium]
MDNPLQNGMNEDAQHPPREQLLLYVDKELAPKEAAQIETHLGVCWSCRAHISKIEKSIADFMEFDGAILAPNLSPPPNGWRDFDRALRQVAAESGRRSLLSIVSGSFGRLFSRARHLVMPRLWIRIAIGFLAAILITALLLRSNRVPIVSASELLRNAAEAQAAKLRAVEEPVVYQKLRVRRATPASARAETADWETWNDTTRRRFRQSVEDSGVLVELARLLQANHMDPQRPLSTASYQSWRDSLDQKREEVARTRLTHGLEALSLRTIPAGQVNVGQISEATLGVREQDWLPYELRLKVRAEDGERIYEITEQASEVAPLAKLSPEIFAERPVVIAPSPAPKPSPISLALRVNPAPTVAPPVAPPVAVAELEVEVLSLLNQVGAMLGEEVGVRRTTDGLLRIEGVVENAERKTTILSALAAVKDQPAVKLQIETPEEAEQRLQQSRQRSDTINVQIQEATPSSNTIPVDAEVRRHLTAQGTPADKLDEAVNQFANRTLRRSRQAILYAWSLRKLVELFSSNELRVLHPHSRAKWLAMIGKQAQGYQREIAALRQELSPVFNVEPLADEAVGEFADESDMTRATLRLNDLGADADEAVRSAFTLSAGGAPAIRSPQFWRALGGAESLAQKIEKAAQQLKSAINTERH